MFCAPHIKQGQGQVRTCFSKKALARIAKAYNDSYPSAEPIALTASKTVLWKAIHKRLYPVCKDLESCWLDTEFAKRHGLSQKMDDVFVPKKPTEWHTDNKTWLSNWDIESVMTQYEKLYKNFRFVGVFPIDYDHVEWGKCISEELCALDLMRMRKKGKEQMAVVFNLDKHNQPGSHWVALYAHLNPLHRNFGVYYFDSNGMLPPKEVGKLMLNMRKQLNVICAQEKKKGKAEQCMIAYNNVRHQYGNSECGMFCLYFILQSLQGLPFKKLVYQKVYDNFVNQLRNVLFRPSVY